MIQEQLRKVGIAATPRTIEIHALTEANRRTTSTPRSRAGRSTPRSTSSPTSTRARAPAATTSAATATPRSTGCSTTARRAADAGGCASGSPPNAADPARRAALHFSLGAAAPLRRARRPRRSAPERHLRLFQPARVAASRDARRIVTRALLARFTSALRRLLDRPHRRLLSASPAAGRARAPSSKIRACRRSSAYACARSTASTGRCPSSTCAGSAAWRAANGATRSASIGRWARSCARRRRTPSCSRPRRSSSSSVSDSRSASPRRRGRARAVDQGMRVLSLALWSLPTFWLGLMLLACLRSRAGRSFRPARCASVDADSFGLWRRGLDLVWHLALPAAAIGLPAAAATARFVRSTVLERLGEPFVQSARARGLSAAPRTLDARPARRPRADRPARRPLARAPCFPARSRSRSSSAGPASGAPPTTPWWRATIRCCSPGRRSPPPSFSPGASSPKPCRPGSTPGCAMPERVATGRRPAPGARGTLTALRAGLLCSRSSSQRSASCR